MTEADHASALRLIDALKGRGVRTFEGFGIKVELDAVDAPPPKGDKRADENICRCGHHVDEHVNGLCIRNCEPVACAPAEGAPK